jgi:hypothetical protein
LESAPITLSLLQYYRPAQPSLCAFEHEKLEVPAVIVDWDTPLAIMVLEHQRIIDSDPRAPLNGCGCAAQFIKGSGNDASEIGQPIPPLPCMS